MLIVPTPDFLGSEPVNMSGREAIAKSREERRKVYQQKRDSAFPDLDNLTNIEARLGRALPHTVLVDRIKQLTNNRVWAEDSINMPGHANFYTMRDGEKVCLAAAFEKGALPEFSYLLKDEMGLPAREVRGWLTVLTRLIQSRVITKRQAEKAFGITLDTDQHARWRINTRNFT